MPELIAARVIDIIFFPLFKILSHGLDGIHDIPDLCICHRRMYGHAYPPRLVGKDAVGDFVCQFFGQFIGYFQQLVAIGARTGTTSPHLYTVSVIQ